MTNKFKQALEEEIGRELIMEPNGVKYSLVCQYFRREKGNGLDLKKGLALIGMSGTLKSTLMRVARSQIMKRIDETKKLNPDYFGMVMCNKAVMEYNANDQEAIDHYTIESEEGIFSPKIWCFDELGRESRGKYERNVMKEIFEYRYEMFVNHGIRTHFTSNLPNTAAIEQQYGEHVRDRLTEMCNFIKFTGKSLRR